LNGKVIREIYVPSEQLPSHYDPTITFIRSTNKPRTFASAQALLYGLYPANSSETCFATLVINTMDREYENMVPNEAICPRLLSLQADMQNSMAYKSYINLVQSPLVQAATKVFSLPPKYKWAGIFDCVQANLCHNRTLPAGLDQALYGGVVDDHFFTNELLYHWLDASGYNYAQIAMGSFVTDFYNRLENVVQNKTNERLAIFSGHDNTVEPLLVALGVEPTGSPPYAAIMRIELLDGGEQGDLIRLYYDDRLLTIPLCGGYSTCPYAIFRQLCKDLVAASSYCTK